MVAQEAELHTYAFGSLKMYENILTYLSLLHANKTTNWKNICPPKFLELKESIYLVIYQLQLPTVSKCYEILKIGFLHYPIKILITYVCLKYLNVVESYKFYKHVPPLTDDLTHHLKIDITSINPLWKQFCLWRTAINVYYLN